MRHIADLFRTAKRITMNQVEAEDLVQETFMQAWKSFEQYEPGTNCRAWLYKIMFNKFDHQRRKKYTQAKYFQEAVDLTFLTAAYQAPVPENLTDRQITEALDKLPEHYRSVVLLADVHEFDYKEVAQVLEIPIGTVVSAAEGLSCAPRSRRSPPNTASKFRGWRPDDSFCSSCPSLAPGSDGSGAFFSWSRVSCPKLRDGIQPITDGRLFEPRLRAGQFLSRESREIRENWQENDDF